MSNEIYKLAIALGFAFIVPAIGYLIGIVWSSSVAKIFGVPPNPKVRRLAATFFLGLPVFALVSYVWLDFDGLRDWWLQSPVSATVLGLLVFALVPGFLIRAIIKLWRPGERARAL